MVSFSFAGRFGDEFIEKRKEKLQMWMNRICLHPVLSQSTVFRHFITCADNEKVRKPGHGHELYYV